MNQTKTILKKLDEEDKLPFGDHWGILVRYLNKLKRRINKYDYDAFVVIVGLERYGKSTFASQIGRYINEDMPIENICMSMDEFIKALQRAKKGEVIIFDEAGTNLLSRESMTSMNRMLIKAFMISGLKNICIILCLPSFFLLDSYIRNHRINILLRITKRGDFLAYSSKRAKKISLYGLKGQNYNVVKANTSGYFTKVFPKDLEEAYKKKESKFKLSFIRDIKDLREGFYSLTKCAEVTGYNIKTIYRLIDSKEIRAKKIARRWYIPKTEAERIVKERKDGWNKPESKE